MSGFCVVCGRELKKTEGPVGPKCLQKIKPRTLRHHNIMPKAQRIKIASKHDIYLEEEEDGQRQADASGKGATAKETEESCSSCKAAASDCG